MPTEVAGPATFNSPAGVCFGSQLRQRRQERRWSQRELGLATHFSREYVALIERGQRRPTAAFVERAEAALQAEGALLRTFAAIERARVDTRLRRPTQRRSRSAAAEAALALRRSASHTTAQGRDLGAVRPALDGLLDAVRADLDADQVSGRLDELERRYTELLGQDSGCLSMEDLVCTAALAVQDCHAVLSAPIVGGLVERAAAVMAQFALLVASALDALALQGDAQGWYNLAASVHPPVEAGPELATSAEPDAVATIKPADSATAIDCAHIATPHRPSRGRSPSMADGRPLKRRRPPNQSRLRRRNIQAHKLINGVRGSPPSRRQRPARAPPSSDTAT